MSRGSSLFLARANLHLREIPAFELAGDVSAEAVARKVAFLAGDAERWPEMLKAAEEKVRWADFKANQAFRKARRNG